MTQGRLNSVLVPAGSESLVYTVPAGTCTTATICLVNTGTTAAKIRMFISNAATHSIADAIEYDAILQPGGVLERSCMPMGENEKVIVSSDVAGVAARVAGFEGPIV